MPIDAAFTRVAILVTAFKRLPNGRVRSVRGHFRHVRPSGFAFRPDDVSCPVAGRIEIDLSTLTTDTPERDGNVVTHLFQMTRAVTATVVQSSQMLEPNGADGWKWRGFVELSLGMRVPVVLALGRRRLADRTEITGRLTHPIDLSVTALGFPFARFVEALGVGSVIDRIEIDVGVAFDEHATRPRVRVAIAGGGIAGLASAQALVDAGCDVTVLEKESVCGGKLTSHVDETLGHTVEHGIHGVFPRYQNLMALWSEAGIGQSVFADTVTVGVASPSGMASGNFHDLSGSRSIVREMIPRGILRARDIAAVAAFLARVFGASADRDMLDRETFQALLDRYGVSERVQRFVMHPYVKNLAYARPDQVSAAAACDALGYYLFDNVEYFKARWLDGGPQELVIDPWVAELSKRGVRFLTRCPVQFVVFEDGRFQGFATRAVIPTRRLNAGDRCWVQRFGSRVVALRWQADGGELRAWDGLCTHAGCPLQPAGEQGREGFRCDCHGGAFDVDGRVLRGPPKQDLRALPVLREEVGGEAFWKIALEESDDGDALLAADYGVVALDVEGARRVLTPTLLDLPSTGGIPMLRSTPLMVLRMWFRGEGYDGPDSGFFEASDLLDNFFVVSRFQREFRDVRGFTVVECHIGDCASIEVRDDTDVLVEAARCLARYFPELGPETLDVGRSRVLRHQQGFPLFAPGDAGRTPAVAAEDRPNLFFAGDWVRSNVRSWYMERAAVTGIEAANNVLAREGYGVRSIRSTDDASVVPKLIGLPFRASGAIGRVYRSVVDGDDEEGRFDSGRWRSSDDRRSEHDEESAPAPRVTIDHSSSRLLDVAELLPRADLARVHPSVREFYDAPARFEMTARFRMSPLLEQAVRRGVPVPPLDALGLLAARQLGDRRECPVVMRIHRGADGRVHWGRFVTIDGSTVTLITSEVHVVDGYLREVVDTRGTSVTLDFRPRIQGRGICFELARTTPRWIYTAVTLSYHTQPTTDGVSILGEYRHRLLRIDGSVELGARGREQVPAPPLTATAQSEVRLKLPSIPPKSTGTSKARG